MTANTPGEAFLIAKQLFLSGTPNEEILAYIQNNGFSEEEAESILEQVHAEVLVNNAPDTSSNANFRVVLGFVVLGAGIFFSFMLKTGFLFYGAIVVGAIMIFRGFNER